MSLLKRNLQRKKLKKYLESADDEAFFEMVWAVDALQSGREPAAAERIRYPKEAATSEIASAYALHEWDLETIIGQLLTVPKDPRRVLDCTQFNTIANITQVLRELEDAEANIYLKRTNILNEMHRMGQRQFSWQRGYFNLPQFYRYFYLYGQGECASYFKQSTCLSTEDFSLVGFILFVAFQSAPSFARNTSLVRFGVTTEVFERALTLLAMPIAGARRTAKSDSEKIGAKLGAQLPTAYQPSFLRRFPIVSFGQKEERLRTPLIQLIPLRVTAGMYYDTVRGPSGLRNEIGGKFEKYCADYRCPRSPEASCAIQNYMRHLDEV